MISCIIEEIAEYIPIISTLCEKGEIQKMLCRFLFTLSLLFTHWWMTSFICLPAGQMFFSRLIVHLQLEIYPSTMSFQVINKQHQSFLLNSELDESQPDGHQYVSFIAIKTYFKDWAVCDFKYVANSLLVNLSLLTGHLK